MENKIKSLIGSFADTLESRYLEILDNLLFRLLFEKERYLCCNRANSKTAYIDKILSRYSNYRLLIYNRLIGKRRADKKLIAKSAFLPLERMVLLVTHNCQLQCKYCRVKKFPSAMNKDTLKKAIKLMFTSYSQNLQFQFFGGEPLLEYELIKEAIHYILMLNRKFRKNVSFILTTNGINLTSEKIAFFKKYNINIEYSIDGEIKSQLLARKDRNGVNYYSRMIENFKNLKASRIPHYSISVFMPENVEGLFKNFEYLAGLGFERLQVNYALGVLWPKEKIKLLFAEFEKIINFLKNHNKIEFMNLTLSRREPVVLNAELTVDCDGSMYYEPGICLDDNFLTLKKNFFVSHIADSKNINFFSPTRFQNFYRLCKKYAAKSNKHRKIILNNILTGRDIEMLLKTGRESYDSD